MISLQPREFMCRRHAILTVLILATTVLAGADDDPPAVQRKQAHDTVTQIRHQRNIAPETVTDEQIVAAMKRAIDFLFKNQANGNWESVASWSRDPLEGDQKGGETALVLLALLEAGQSIDDPRLKFRSPELTPVVDYVMKLQSDRTYVLGIQAAAIALLPQTKEYKYHLALRSIKDQLVGAIEQSPAYGYSVKKENNEALVPEQQGFTIPYRGRILTPIWRWDNSNAQYALLGVWAAADAGLPVPPEYWAVQDAMWRATQCKNGAWTYNIPINQPGHARSYETGKDLDRILAATAFQRPSLTAAGLASLYVTQEFLDTDVRMDPRPDPVITNGLKNFTENLDPCFPDGYYLYGVERVGLASGYKYFGAVDWYREIAATLIAVQQDSGAWLYQMNMGVSPNVGTAYGLLTLARGRNPILFNKLEYTGSWNARPRDAANITRWMTKTFERPLNWQIVNTDVPGEDWLDAPILLITGPRDPKFTRDQLVKIKAFIEAGGLVLSNADGGSELFTTAMKKYAAEVTGKIYEMRLLPRDHPIFSMHYDIKNPPPIWGISNGSRELWLHTTTDLGAAWQRRLFTNKLAFEIPANIYFYATGKGKLRPRLQPPVPTAGGGGEEKKNINVGRIEFSGNWNPEPGAWARLARTAKAKWSTGITTTTLHAAQLDPAKATLAHITGTGKLSLSPDDLAGLKAYLGKGGTLLIDAAGGNPAFAQSAEETIKTLNVGPIEPLFANDPLFTPAKPGMQAITEFDYRGPLQKFAGRKPDGPLLQGVKINNRWAILLSPQDITAGFLNTHTWLQGYAPETAQAITRNLLFSAQQNP
jgi:hypothetical protein